MLLDECSCCVMILASSMVVLVQQIVGLKIVTQLYEEGLFNSPGEDW